jgi:putative transcriptional regulator
MTALEIKQLRKKRKMTQLKFAEVLGVPLRTLQDWEYGIHAPSAAASALLKTLRTKREVKNEKIRRSP